MSRIAAGARALIIAGMVSVGASLGGCSSDNPASANAAGVIGSGGATIEGIPQSTAVVGQLYVYVPQVSDSSTSTSFKVQNLPGWAKFNAATGELSGTPSSAEIGVYSNIVITMIDAGIATPLPAFSITVAATGNSDNVTLSWQAPTQNADGTPLLNLQGYEIHYGTASKSYSETVKIANPGVTDYVVQNLAPGKYYFALTAYNSAGVQSSLSGEVSTVINN